MARTFSRPLLAFGLLLAVVAGPVSLAEGAPPKEQRVEGVIYAPTAGACEYLAFQEALLETAARSGKLVGQMFRVDPRTWGGRFVLRSVDAPVSDLDISFFGFSTEHTTRAVGGERGIVPRGAEWGHVCLHSGVATSFVYTGSAGQSKR